MATVQFHLGDVCLLRAGTAFKKQHQGLSSGDLPFIKVSDMNRPSNEFQIREANHWLNEATARSIKAKPFPAGTVVFAKIGEALKQNRVRLLTRPTLIDNNMMGAIPSLDLVEPRYLLAVLATAGLDRWATGTAMPYLTQGTLNRMPVLLPPLEVQRKAVGVLAAYDELIENNLRRIEILEEMAQAVYREWFVNFRYPGHEAHDLVDSPLGLIPSGWGVRPFSELGAFINGFAFKPSHWGTLGKPIVKIKELKNGITADTPRYDGDGLDAKYHIDTGDLLFSWSADLDAYLWNYEPALLNQHLFRVVPGEGIELAHLFHALKDRMPEFRLRSQGTTMKHIKRVALSEVTTVLPSAPVRGAFAEHVAPMHRLVSNLTAQNANLRATRDLLLPRLVSGEIDVSELDIDTSWLVA